MKKFLTLNTLTAFLLAISVSAAGFMMFGAHTLAKDLSSVRVSPSVQYDSEDIAPPEAPETPVAPEPDAIDDPALSPDSAVTEPDPLVEQPEPRIEQPEPYVEEGGPVMEDSPVVEEGDPLVNEPEPLVNEPEPLVEQPEPMVDEPEAVVPEGEPLGDREAEGRGLR